MKTSFRACALALSSLAVAAAATMTLSSPALAAARSRPRQQVRILGFTTFTRIGIPQVQAKPGRTITDCYTRGDGEREVNVVYSGRGIAKGTKVGVALWGGEPRGGYDVEPAVAEIMRSAFKWPVRAEQSRTLAYGYLFATGPFGPVRIDGRWTASIVVAGRVVVRKSVTIACA
ncbi:hypothetical protein [Conexibacter sp. CPCC 206217]|uniref:hypothetical protein n=1 Tax=Conexibacter sp. CPCC 206217 TaxID=3064574 RepID=UPI00271C262F|nr:hypothetical protein [Conexibacter sp. CPCC 206217]MDO8211618.1 hypothetical protein [Conexibacter sp. CPCC 206217]